VGLAKGKWRVGRKVPINVYEGNTPVCQCQTVEYARRIVEAVNAREFGEKLLDSVFGQRPSPKPRKGSVPLLG
jgi:hypothetical protein